MVAGRRYLAALVWSAASVLSVLAPLCIGAPAGKIPPRADYADCLACHQGIEHAGDGHDLACGRCHLEPKAVGGPLADHGSIVPNPSAPGKAETFCAPCHREEVASFNSSSHATLAGIINQTRYLWGAQPNPEPLYSANAAIKPLPAADPVGETPPQLADDLLRRRCLRCHNGTKGGGADGLWRGAGCASCHVRYHGDGKYRGGDKAISPGQTGRPASHGLTANISDHNCLACHNSNHVGADYHGYFERDLDSFFQEAISRGKPVLHRFGLAQHRLARDLHAEKGLSCLDCHQKKDVMGDGAPRSHGLKTPRTACRDCHGGFQREMPRPGLRGVVRGNNGPAFLDRKGRKHVLPLFRGDHPSHAADAHKRLRCSACHAQWSYQDYGFNLMLQLGGDFRQWGYLTAQNDPARSAELERLAAGNKGPQSQDWLSGISRKGVWILGYGFRRWEPMPLGVDYSGRIALLRPMHQYLVSLVDELGMVILDGTVPRRGDASGPGWAFLPYAPHTTSPRGRPCFSCHQNQVAAGLGLAPEGDLALSKVQPPPPGMGRLLNRVELARLLRPGPRFRQRAARTYQGLIRGARP